MSSAWRYGLLAAVSLMATSCIAPIPMGFLPAATIPPREYKVEPTSDSLPEETEAGVYFIEDDSVFDLRGWLPPIPNPNRHSPAVLTETMRLTREPATKQITLHYDTSGSAIDLTCMTHPYRVQVVEGRQIHPGYKEYAVTFDVSSEPPGKPFTMIVRATYWDGFERPLEDASTYTLHTPDQTLVLAVLFPDKLRPSWFYRESGPADSGQFAPYLQDDMQIGKDNSWLKWIITKKAPDTHYRLTWSWDIASADPFHVGQFSANLKS